jgi:hypothetical protein
VSALHAQWAIDFVNRDVEGTVEHYKSGSVGNGDHRLGHEVRKAFEAYLQLQPKQRQVTYKVPKTMLDKPVAPYSYFVRRLQRLTPFQQDMRGADKALVATLASLVAEGVLNRLAPQQAASQFNSTQALYCQGEGW